MSPLRVTPVIIFACAAIMFCQQADKEMEETLNKTVSILPSERAAGIAEFAQKKAQNEKLVKSKDISRIINGLDQKEDIRTLHAMLQYPKVRAWTIEAIGRYKHDQISPELITKLILFLSDKDYVVRAACWRALKSILAQIPQDKRKPVQDEIAKSKNPYAAEMIAGPFDSVGAAFDEYLKIAAPDLLIITLNTDEIKTLYSMKMLFPFILDAHAANEILEPFFSELDKMLQADSLGFFFTLGDEIVAVSKRNDIMTASKLKDRISAWLDRFEMLNQKENFSYKLRQLEKFLKEEKKRILEKCVESSIRRGVKYLRDYAEKTLLTNEKSPPNQYDALVFYTLIKSGEPISDALMRKLLDRVVKADYKDIHTRVYCNALAAMGLATFFEGEVSKEDSSRAIEKVKECGTYLRSAQGNEGLWHYNETMKTSFDFS